MSSQGQPPPETPTHRTRPRISKGFRPVPEVAEKNVKELQAGQRQGPKLASSSVMVVHGGAPTICYCCNSTSHLAQDCKIKAAKCCHCGKVGHIQKACCSKGLGTRSTRERRNASHYVLTRLSLRMMSTPRRTHHMTISSCHNLRLYLYA